MGPRRPGVPHARRLRSRPTLVAGRGAGRRRGAPGSYILLEMLGSGRPGRRRPGWPRLPVPPGAHRTAGPRDLAAGSEEVAEGYIMCVIECVDRMPMIVR